MAEITIPNNRGLSPAVRREQDRQLQHMAYRTDVTKHAMNEGADTQAHAAVKAAELATWDSQVLGMVQNIDSDLAQAAGAFIKGSYMDALECMGEAAKAAYLQTLDQVSQIPVAPKHGLLQEAENAIHRLLTPGNGAGG